MAYPVDYVAECPYCGEENTFRFDGGKRCEHFQQATRPKKTAWFASDDEPGGRKVLMEAVGA